jgi:small subunit ribosomal protein S9
MADEPTDTPEEQVEPDHGPELPTGDASAAPEAAPTDTAEGIVESDDDADAATSEQPPVEPVATEAPTEALTEAPTEEAAVAPPADRSTQQPTTEAGDLVQTAAEEDGGEEEGGEAQEEEEPAPRVKPSVPGAHLEVDIVPEGVDPLAPEQPSDPYAIEEDEEQKSEEADTDAAQLPEPISSAAIDLAAGARYKATGKRKTAIARVILRPGTGAYMVNGRALDDHFPRVTLQRNIRQPLETVGYQDRMDVVARLHGGGISAQAGALRHGISRALLEADPNLRGELKRRGFLTRDSRAKERKKAGLKKARKRPQFSKR